MFLTFNFHISRFFRPEAVFSALLPFRGMRRQYVVGTAQHSCDTVLSRAADVGLWVLIW